MKYYLKADSLEYLNYLSNLKAVSRADMMIRPVFKNGMYHGYLPNGYQETTARYIKEITN